VGEIAEAHFVYQQILLLVIKNLLRLEQLIKMFVMIVGIIIELRHTTLNFLNSIYSTL
jgi:hypothetical protein